MPVSNFICVSFLRCESEQIPSEGETRAPLSLLAGEALTEPSKAEGFWRCGSRAGLELRKEETSSEWSIKVKPSSYNDLDLLYLTYLSVWNIIRLVTELQTYIRISVLGREKSQMKYRNVNDSPLHSLSYFKPLCQTPLADSHRQYSDSTSNLILCNKWI